LCELKQEFEVNSSCLSKHVSTAVEDILLCKADDGMDKKMLRLCICVIKICVNTVNNLFKKPTVLDMEHFLKSHPQLPKINLSTPFNFQKTFYRSDGVQRMWLTYNSNSKQLFCYLCLSFSNESNSFTTCMSSWKYVYQRINEHESSKIHKHCVEAYLLFTQNHKRKEEVTKNKKIFKRIIDCIIFIGKRGLSYRGNKFEAAYSLNNLHDHGNFLELLLLLSNYDPVIKDHLDTVAQKSIKANKAGCKGRGNSLTFISKTTVDYIISAICTLIKKSISTDVNNAQMYSVILDTTQDITVKDQCAIVIRYVDNHSVHERLISLNVLKLNDINVKNCVANATDGAANMQGEYNGFNAWLNETAPNQVHVWCYSHVLNLVMSDASKSLLPAATLFTLLNSLATFFKESYKRMEYFTKRCTSNLRLQSIAETQWWGKEIALNRIFGKLMIHPKVYIKVKADHMRTSLLNITGPLSKYLQTKDMDLLKSQEL
ncbi:Zinc finger MYM-type protein 1, partial [Aphis craccivora]